MTFPPKLYFLQSFHQSGKLSTRLVEHNTSYIVGFMRNQDALHVCRNIGPIPNIDMGYHIPDTSDNVVDTEEGSRLLVVVNKPSPVIFQKEFTPNWDWEIETIDTEMALKIPILKNIGMILPIHVIDETANSITFESYIIDPVNQPNMFRHSLDWDSI